MSSRNRAKATIKIAASIIITGVATSLVGAASEQTNQLKKVDEWPETKVRAAIDYAATYPDEIEPLINRARGMTGETLRRLNAA